MSREKIANEILPGLWLGAVEAVESISFLKTNHIEVVISLMGEKPLVAEGWGRKGEHIYFEIEDAPDCDLLSIFPGAIKEIKLAQVSFSFVPFHVIAIFSLLTFPETSKRLPSPLCDGNVSKRNGGSCLFMLPKKPHFP